MRQSKAIFDSEARKLYQAEPEEFRARLPLAVFVATLLVPEINRYLSRRASRFPTIQPER